MVINPTCTPFTHKVMLVYGHMEIKFTTTMGSHGPTMLIIIAHIPQLHNLQIIPDMSELCHVGHAMTLR